jgi:hypothetical protein
MCTRGGGHYPLSREGVLCYTELRAPNQIERDRCDRSVEASKSWLGL